MPPHYLALFNQGWWSWWLALPLISVITSLGVHKRLLTWTTATVFCDWQRDEETKQM